MMESMKQTILLEEISKLISDMDGRTTVDIVDKLAIPLPVKKPSANPLVELRTLVLR